jgi:hypothetical protein
MQIDLNAYFDKIYKGIKEREEASAAKKIAVLNKQITTVNTELAETISTAFIDRVQMLVKSDVITPEDAKKIAKKYGVVIKTAAPKPKTSDDSCGHGGSSVSARC